MDRGQVCRAAPRLRCRRRGRAAGIAAAARTRRIGDAGRGRDRDCHGKGDGRTQGRARHAAGRDHRRAGAGNNLGCSGTGPARARRRHIGQAGWQGIGHREGAGRRRGAGVADLQGVDAVRTHGEITRVALAQGQLRGNDGIGIGGGTDPGRGTEGTTGRGARGAGIDDPGWGRDGGRISDRRLRGQRPGCNQQYRGSEPNRKSVTDIRCSTARQVSHANPLGCPRHGVESVMTVRCAPLSAAGVAMTTAVGKQEHEKPQQNSRQAGIPPPCTMSCPNCDPAT